MKIGDILLVKYKRDPISWIIRKYVCGEYNHAAWVINDFVVCEVRATGINFYRIDRYRNNKLYKIKLLRIPSVTHNGNMKIMTCMIDKFKKYSLLDYLLLILSIWLKFIPKGLYTCSGLIATALSKIGWHFDNANKQPYFITPTDIEKTVGVIDVTKEF